MLVVRSHRFGISFYFSRTLCPSKQNIILCYGLVNSFLSLFFVIFVLFSFHTFRYKIFYNLCINKSKFFYFFIWDRRDFDRWIYINFSIGFVLFDDDFFHLFASKILMVASYQVFFEKFTYLRLTNWLQNVHSYLTFTSLTPHFSGEGALILSPAGW